MASSSGGAPAAEEIDVADEVPCVSAFFRDSVGLNAAGVIDLFIGLFMRAALRIWKPDMLQVVARVVEYILVCFRHACTTRPEDCQSFGVSGNR